MKAFFKQIQNILSNKNNCVLCTVISSNGSTPRKAGAKMLVKEDGSIIGTIGGGMVEYKAIQMAKTVFEQKTSMKIDYNLSNNAAAGIGMVCGGNVTVFFQYISYENPECLKAIDNIVNLLDNESDLWLVTLLDSKKFQIGSFDQENGLKNFDPAYQNLISENIADKPIILENEKLYIEPISKSGFVYIFGGGHISRELVPLLEHTEFRPVIFEDRKEFADSSLFNNKAKTILGDFEHPEKYIKINKSDYIVIMTRGHKADYETLKFALNSPASYIGLIGSKSKMNFTKEKLLKDNISEDSFSRIHNPIGLAIKAVTPAEIAISVAAELILHRNSLNFISKPEKNND